MPPTPIFQSPHQASLASSRHFIDNARPDNGAVLGQTSVSGFMVSLAGPRAMIRRKPRQARKGATVAADSCAVVWLAGGATHQSFIPSHLFHSPWVFIGFCCSLADCNTIAPIRQPEHKQAHELSGTGPQMEAQELW